MDVRSHRVTKLVKTPPGADFLVWTPDGIVLTASGTTLYQWDPQSNAEWKPVADLAPAGVANVTRLAVSPHGDRLAIVAIPAAH